jgi:hypothetical protein
MEVFNMSTTPDTINGGAIQYGRHWQYARQMRYPLFQINALY